ncbi:hypothetical protein FGB62_38g03 [Gracilaria domingensis]|nr:hypothetical protein FGB62_38g03 [Gracilaria domingensis]
MRSGFWNCVETVSHQEKFKEDCTECGSDRDINESRTIALNLLVKEEEREGMTLQVAEKEKMELDAGVKDTTTSKEGSLSKRTHVRPKDLVDRNKLDTLAAI